ncbi:hypothetical protein MAR_013704, partial [Mya arenaria]
METSGLACKRFPATLESDGSADYIPDYLMEVSSPDFDVATAKEWFSLEDTNGDGYVIRDELINIATK